MPGRWTWFKALGRSCSLVKGDFIWALFKNRCNKKQNYTIDLKRFALLEYRQHRPTSNYLYPRWCDNHLYRFYLLTYLYSLNSPSLITYLHITDFPILYTRYQEQITNQKNIATTDFLRMTQILNLHVIMLCVDKPWKSLLCSQQFEQFVVFHVNALFVMIYCIE